MFRIIFIISVLYLNSSLAFAQQYSQEIIDYLKDYKEAEELLIEQFEKLDSKVNTLETRIEKIETKIEVDESVSSSKTVETKISNDENNIISKVSEDNNVNNFIEEYDASNAFVLDKISIIANRTPTELTKVGSSVTIINQEEINKSSDTFLIDFIDKIPGVQTYQSGSPGTISEILIRGSKARYVKVLIDGIDVTDVTSPQAQPYLSSFLLKNVERIEVLKGAQSTLYGGQASGGVISITSKKTKKKGISNSLSYEFGSYNTSNTNYSFNLRTDKSDTSVNISSFDTDGFSAAEEDNGNTEADGSNMKQASIITNIYPNETTDLYLGVYSTKSNFNYDNWNQTDNSDTGDYDSIGLSAGLNLNNKNLNHNFSISNYINHRRDGSYVYEGDRLNLSYKLSGEISDNINFVTGIDKEDDEGKIGAVGSFSKQGVYGEAIIDLSDNTTSTLGLRYDDHSKYGGHSVYRGTINHRFFQDLIFKASLGTGFRPPSVYELGNLATGVTNLNPEESESIDIGISKLFNKYSSINAGAFKSEISNRIDWTSGGYDNISTLEERQGFEIDYSFKPSNSFQGMISYSRTSDENGDQVSRVPLNQLTANINYAFNNSINTSLELKRVSDLKDGNNDLPDYDLVNTKINYSIGNSNLSINDLNVYFKIVNLLNEEYQLVKNYGTSDRAFYFGIESSF